MDRPPEPVLAAAETLFGTISDIIEAGDFPPDQVERRKLVLSSTMQGISTFVAAGRATPAQGDIMIDDAISLFLGEPLA
jgi:hypothetical protein